MCNPLTLLQFNSLLGALKRPSLTLLGFCVFSVVSAGPDYGAGSDTARSELKICSSTIISWIPKSDFGCEFSDPISKSAFALFFPSNPQMMPDPQKIPVGVAGLMVSNQASKLVDTQTQVNLQKLKETNSLTQFIAEVAQVEPQKIIVRRCGRPAQSTMPCEIVIPQDLSNSEKEKRNPEIKFQIHYFTQDQLKTHANDKSSPLHSISKAAFQMGSVVEAANSDSRSYAVLISGESRITGPEGLFSGSPKFSDGSVILVSMNKVTTRSTITAVANVIYFSTLDLNGIESLAPKTPYETTDRFLYEIYIKATVGPQVGVLKLLESLN